MVFKKIEKEFYLFFFLFFLTHFQIQFKLIFNSFANFNQSKASQNKYAVVCMHTHVCRPIFDFNFNKVIIFPRFQCSQNA